MRPRRASLLVACTLALALAGPGAAHAQTAAEPPMASLVADSLRIESDETLIAEGNVEVFYDGVRLSAERIVFDRTADTIDIAGPIRLVDAAGSIVFADAARLDRDLSDGILRSARVVLDQQLQLAAAEISRDGARYTRMRRVVASSCEVCPDNPTPLWEIRASGVVHDQIERQLYFENAQLRVGGVPVFYVPRLRLPDPTLDRARGFLVPDIRTATDLGTGVIIPYFVPIGDSADVTVAPYLASGTTTIEGRYRQELGFGRLAAEGAFTLDDDILGGQNRWFVFADGRFDLPYDFTLTFGLQTVSDPTYLLDYDYSDIDRLQSSLVIGRVRDQSYTTGGLIRYTTLREAEIPTEDTLPEYVGQIRHTRRLPFDAIGGETWLSLDTRVLTRPSNEDIVGRDDLRVGASIDWRRDWLGPAGLVFDATAGLALDAYRVRDDSTFPTTPTRATPWAAAGLRWPLERTDAGGARQLLEPAVQLVYSRSFGDAVPNEDSTLVELDEGNLFAISRYPGDDARETGARANVGVTWQRSVPGGLTMGITAGRILRFSDTGQFAADTGLAGDRSDWLAAIRLGMGERLALTSRSLVDDSFDISRSETRLDWVEDWGAVSTSYLWSDAVPSEGRDTPLSEWTLAAAYEINRNWQARVDWRYDFAGDRATRAGLGLQYRNECIGVDLSVSRRFTSSETLSPSTTYRLRLSVNGFGSGNDGREFRRSCTG